MNWKLINTVLLFAFLIVAALSVNAQKEDTTSILAEFSLRQVDDRVQVNFAIKGGAQCNGVELERSGNGADFEVVDFIPGICGGTDRTEYYTVVDEEPVTNRESFYRLQLGQQERTQVLSITFVSLKDGFRVFPNPAVDFTLIRFNNPQEREHELYIFDSKGLLIEMARGITSNEVFMDLSNYSSGMYYFTLISPQNGSVKGKFIVSSHHD